MQQVCAESLLSDSSLVQGSGLTCCMQSVQDAINTPMRHPNGKFRDLKAQSCIMPGMAIYGLTVAAGKHCSTDASQ